MSSPGPSATGRGPSSASFLAVLAMVAWGVAYVPSAWLVETWPPLMAAAARIGIGGLILLIALRALGRPVMPGTEWRVILVLALTQSGAFYGATFIGIAVEGAGFAAVLVRIGAVHAVVVARGADGSVVATKDGAWHAAAAPVEVVSAVGAGGSFVAGFVLALSRGWPMSEALALGTAAASAAVMTPATDLCHADDVRHFYSQRDVTLLTPR